MRAAAAAPRAAQLPRLLCCALLTAMLSRGNLLLQPLLLQPLLLQRLLLQRLLLQRLLLQRLLLQKRRCCNTCCCRSPSWCELLHPCCCLL